MSFRDWRDVSDFKGCRRLWLAGLCPCCGGDLDDWEWEGVVHEPQAVAEGVMFCGRCIANEHHTDPPQVLPLLLESLLP